MNQSKFKHHLTKSPITRLGFLLPVCCHMFMFATGCMADQSRNGRP